MKETSNVAEEYMLGNTKVKICDDFCKHQTKEQVNQILDRIAQIALEMIQIAL